MCKRCSSEVCLYDLTHTHTHTHTHTQESSLGDLHRDLKSATPKRAPRLHANSDDEPPSSSSGNDSCTSLSEVQLSTLEGPDFASAMPRNGHGAWGGGRDFGGGSCGLFSPDPSLSSSFFIAGNAMRLPTERVDLRIAGPTLDTVNTASDTVNTASDTVNTASDAGRESICSNVRECATTVMVRDSTVGTLFLDGVAFNDVPGRLLEVAREREGGRVQGLAGAIRTPPAPAVGQALAVRRSGSPTSPIFRALLKQVVCARATGDLCMAVCIFKLSL